MRNNLKKVIYGRENNREDFIDYGIKEIDNRYHTNFK